MSPFALDPRLDADTFHVGEFELSNLRLMNDRRFPWTILVPRRAGLVELFDLSRADRRILSDEIAIVSEALSRIAAAHKMNVAALGNIVRQLHVHIVARSETDAAWPLPIWGQGAMTPYAAAESSNVIARLAAAAGLKGSASSL